VVADTADKTLKDADDAENAVAVVVARVEVPETARVPFEVRELVKIPSVARRSAVKKLPVEVALVKEAERADKRPPNVADDAFKFDVKKLVEEADENTGVSVSV
jgi:hypothetical protein